MRAVGISDVKIQAAMGLLRESLVGPSRGRSAAGSSVELSQSAILDLRSTRASAGASKRRAVASQRREEAQQHFESALALEESDAIAARARYFAALEVHNDHLEARINLGRLLHLNGELALAEQVYRAARHTSAVLSFNLATLLEDLGRDAEAIMAYRDALTLDPTLHDAHFNLSRLHERGDRSRDALRHLLAYRRILKDVKA
jgi:tetratricopeptide (TPR) repeat protein